MYICVCVCVSEPVRRVCVCAYVRADIFIYVCVYLFSVCLLVCMCTRVCKHVYGCVRMALCELAKVCL